MSVDDPAASEPAGIRVETCFYHRDRETGRHCTRCGRPACTDCLRQASVGSHCFQCVRDAAPAPSEVRRVRRALGPHPLWVTKGLIAVNVAVFLLGVALDGGTDRRIGQLTRDYGLWGPAIDLLDEWYRIVTSGFLHSGLMHIGLNMFVLWFLGKMIEPALGSWRFGLLYAAGLAGGSFGALLVEPEAITVGASGAIYGVMGAAFVGLRARGVDPFQAGIGGLLVIGLLSTFAVPGISVGGHLGGLVAGAVVGWLLLRPMDDRQQLPAVLASSVVLVVGLVGALVAAGI
ncbi:MAG: rhomboid family intramembrane serine protease [Actinomycetota bacterium]